MTMCDRGRVRVEWPRAVRREGGGVCEADEVLLMFNDEAQELTDLSQALARHEARNLGM